MSSTAALKSKPAPQPLQFPGDPVAGAQRVRIVTPGSRIPATRQIAGRRRMITPGTVVLMAFIVFFGMYSTGHLPQFDQWTNSLIHTTQANNDVVVSDIENLWKYVVGAAAALVLALSIIAVRNRLRTRHNAVGDYDFRTR